MRTNNSAKRINKRSDEESKARLKISAEKLFDDYSKDSELTAFPSLDFDDFVHIVFE